MENSDRGLLMNVAYRLLGSVVEAEDAVQEAYARWYGMSLGSREEISSPVGWLVTVTTRICLDVLGSARVRREQYVGEWLPEPVPSAVQWTSHAVSRRSADPADSISLDESLNMALLIVLESMTPAERVTFVLHDVFAYTFSEVSDIVGRSPQACRQLASSARRRIGQARRDSVSIAEHERVVALFHSALESGDLTALIQTLDPNARATPDGGGAVQAAIEPVEGAEQIALYLLGLYRMQPDLSFRVATVNGRAGLVGEDAAKQTLVVITFAIAGGVIRSLWAVRNPDKLVPWS